jgi:glycosyltransferase involved in cell wall biosynthesis
MRTLRSADVARDPFAAPRSRARACSQRRTHVVQFTPTLAGGGAEERIARLSRTLDPLEFRVTWIGFGPIEHALFERAGEAVALWPIERDPRRGVEWRLIASLARRLRALRPDVVHTHNWSTSLYGIGAARLAGVPVIYGDGGRDDPAPPSPRRIAVMRALAPHVALFTAVCRSLGEELQRFWGVGPERVRVIQSGVELLPPTALLSRAEARLALGLPEGAWCVGAIAGRLRPVKRLPELISAVGGLVRGGADVHLALIGDAAEHAEDLHAQARRSGLAARMHLVGHLPRVARYLRALDVVVSASRFEGASNAILEAMAVGSAVLATAVGGTPELLRHGETGWLIPGDELSLLGPSLLRLLADEPLRARLGHAAQAFVVRNHGTEAMTELHAALYRQVASGGARPEGPLRAIGSSLLALLEGSSAPPRFA